MNLKIMYLSLVYASVICITFGEPVTKEKQNHQRNINTNFLKVNDKFDFLFDKVEQLETSTGNDAHIVFAQTEFNTQTLKAMEKVLTKMENFEQLLHKINEKLDQISNPCLNGGRCAVTGSNYKCSDCPYPTSGTHCQDLACGTNKCFSLNDTLYVVIENNTRWKPAKEACELLGMRLAMPQDDVSIEYVLNRLRFLYTRGRTYFWLGLNYTENKWRWLDGSALANNYTVYDFGYPNASANANTYAQRPCGFLNLQGGHTTRSAHSCLATLFDELFYPLCEKHISSG